MAATSTYTLEERILPRSPEAELIQLAAQLYMVQCELDRIKADKDSLPPGWHAVSIDDHTVRINALDDNGNQCHWILCTESDT
jgi:hypothetical protein